MSIEIMNLHYTYGNGTGYEVQALLDVNLTIHRGEYVAVLGPNGSGKSTLARHLNALLFPTSGKVLVDGMDTREKMWEIRRQVGLVFQNPDNQLIAPVVEEDVAFGPENLGLPPSEVRRRVDQALQGVAMGNDRLRAPHLLSGGQKQRVAIAGVIAMHPGYLVLDEPTAMLDPLGRSEVLKTIKQLNRHENLAVILITQFMEEAIDAHRVVVMREGGIYLEGSPAEIFRQGRKLLGIGLDLPPVAKLAQALQADGLPLGQDILTADDLVKELCQL
ncbi:MAG: energy-coupling factor transporter ATPase [Bacillota bacterium]